MKKTSLIIIVVACIGLIVGGYVFWLNQNGNSSENVELSKVQQIITKDLEKQYPATPREVIKTYNEIITCYYNEEYTEEELEELAKQARLLLDEELLANNPWEEYFAALKEEIAEYRSVERVIFMDSVSSSNEVEFHTVDGRECAYVEATYTLKEKNQMNKTYQTYVVRKDDDGDWKILVFYKMEGDASNEE